MNLITQQNDLMQFCQNITDSPYITVDTEFLRDKTYYPKLCLLQIASPEYEAVIDPLSEHIDLTPVFELLQKPDLPKVFHAARQDIEIFLLLSGNIPEPIFDTQIAASVCGYGESVGYENLVNRIVKANVDKSSRFTDWSVRPLTDKQLTYALSDVTHLRDIYEKLIQNVQETGRMAWIKEEHDRLSDPNLYQIDPNDAYKRLKYGNMRPKNLAILREIAGWRENEARQQNIPRGRVLRDETLMELASTPPQKDADFKRLRSSDKHMNKPKMDAVMNCIHTALALPTSAYPEAKKRQKPTENVASAIAMLQLLLKVQSDTNNISGPMLATKDQLESIALGNYNIPAMQGWRYDVFGKKAEALMQGKLTLSLDPSNKQVLFNQ